MTENYDFKAKQKTLPAFNAKSTKELFQKWGMVKTKVQCYSYDNYFDGDRKEDFVYQFFKNSNVFSTFKTISSTNDEACIGNLPFSYVRVDTVPTTVTSMRFFDVLYTSSLVRECGSIRKCFDEVVDNFLVSDELKKMLLSDESEFFDIFSEKEKQEFIFIMFRHIVLGGYCNQYEDNVKPYIETTKYLYKDLMRVIKDKDTNSLDIGSIVLKVTLNDQKGVHVFPGEHEHLQNFCYMIIEPEKRELIVWHHIWDLN